MSRHWGSREQTHPSSLLLCSIRGSEWIGCCLPAGTGEGGPSQAADPNVNLSWKRPHRSTWKKCLRLLGRPLAQSPVTQKIISHHSGGQAVKRLLCPCHTLVTGLSRGESQQGAGSLLIPEGAGVALRGGEAVPG